MAHCFPIRLPPRLHAGSDAYPGWSQSQCRLQRVFICTGFSTALTKFFGAYLNQNSRDWYSTARVSKRPSHKVNRLLTRAVLYRRPNVACYDLAALVREFLILKRALVPCIIATACCLSLANRVAGRLSFASTYYFSPPLSPALA